MVKNTSSTSLSKQTQTSSSGYTNLEQNKGIKKILDDALTSQKTETYKEIKYLNDKITEIDIQIDKQKNEIERQKNEIVTIIGIFVAIFALVIIEIQILNSVNGWAAALGISIISLAGLLSLFLFLDIFFKGDYSRKKVHTGTVIVIGLLISGGLYSLNIGSNDLNNDIVKLNKQMHEIQKYIDIYSASGCESGCKNNPLVIMQIQINDLKKKIEVMGLNE